jgi:hypothetical protein
VDDQKRQQFRQASADELRQAHARGELTSAEFQELYWARPANPQPTGAEFQKFNRDRPANPLLTMLLVTAALLGLGILIFCGGCGLILSKRFR